MIKKSILLAFVLVLVFACGGSDSGVGGDDDSGGVVDDGYNRSAMLTNIADNIIIPAFEDFEDKVDDLVDKVKDFTSNPTTETLADVRTSYITAYTIWQQVELFNVGKSESSNFAAFNNSYPVNGDLILSNISSGTYDLSAFNASLAVRGFPAVDFLLYGSDTKEGNIYVPADSDDEILDRYKTDTDATAFKTYLIDVVDLIKSTTSSVVTDWNNDYRNEFISSTGNETTSSLNVFTNNFVLYYEASLRKDKLGNPIGLFSNNSEEAPEEVEAYYNQEISKDLLLESIEAVENLFNGKAYNGTSEGESFKAYLEYLNRDDIVTAITEQLATIKTSISTLDDNLYDQIINNKTEATLAYEELQSLVLYFKTDMINALGITVSYQDTDGD